MKTPEETKCGLICHINGACDPMCPYFDIRPACETCMSSDALALIRKLESKYECTQMTVVGLIKQLSKRDSVIAQLKSQLGKLAESIEQSAGAVEYDGRTIADWAQVLVNSQWVSTSEKNPPVGVDVLCYFPKYKYGSKIAVSHRESESAPTGKFSEYFRFGEVSHWMPLPLMPQDELDIDGELLQLTNCKNIQEILTKLSNVDKTN